MNPLEQHHLMGEITKILLTQAPAGWNRKEQPPYPTPPEREQYALDQERFPRTPENMPEWFRHGLDG